MWNKFATMRENLSQMASEVLETVEELAPRAAGAEEEDSATSTSSPMSSSRSQEFGKHWRSADGFQSSRRARRVHEERNGSVSSDESGEAATEQDLLKQIQSKELAYRALDENYQHALREVEMLRTQLDSVQRDLAASNDETKTEPETNVSVTNLEVDMTEQREEAEKETAAVAESQSVQDERILEEIRTRDEIITQLRESVAALEKERAEFQAEREQLKIALEQREQEFQQISKFESNAEADVEIEMPKAQAREVDVLLEKLKTAETAFETEKTELRTRLEAVTLEKDKAISNLSRLKQHLLEKENADSEKMDQDSEQIATLEAKAASSNARVLQLELALSQSLATQAETSTRLNEELKASKQELESASLKVNTLYATLEAKDSEIANLQVALGQYYAESHAKERLQRELEIASEELRKLSREVEVAKRSIDVKDLEKNEALDKLRLEEKKSLDCQQKTQKLQEDMFRLRRALEESMIRLNRMSSDSDFSVDRRIVIKLLVTYFEKGHNREVLDLMTRMLGFSEDEKRRVGLAHQNAGKPGVVRSVFGLPGRVVGGLLGGTSEAPGFPAHSNQSFADLWIDFLLKESEERDKKVKEEAVVADEPSLDVSTIHNQSENGFARDDIFEADYSLPPSSTSSLETANRSGHRRVYSRP